MVHIKEPLLLIGKSSPCGGSGFPLSLFEWSFTICLMPYNRKYNVLSASLNKTLQSFLPSFFTCFFASLFPLVNWFVDWLVMLCSHYNALQGFVNQFYCKSREQLTRIARTSHVCYGSSYLTGMHVQLDVYALFIQSTRIAGNPKTNAFSVVFDAAAIPRLTTAECERAFERLMAGDRSDDTAHTFNEHPSIMYRL